MSDSVRPHRQQPTRLLRPWDSPGKNTGVGCHFLLQCMNFETLWTAAYHAPPSMGFSRQEYWSGVPLGHPGSIPGLGRSPGEGNGYPLQYSCPENSMDRPFHFSHSCTGEGNGSPLQCSCLENPKDGEACGLPSMGSHRVGHD